MDADQPPPYALEDTRGNRDTPKNDDADSFEYNMKFTFQPDPGVNYRAEPPWEVILHVQAQDVSYLMRRGFYWYESNLQREKGYIQHHASSQTDDMRDGGWKWSRRYYLENQAGNSAGWWSARLSVYTRTFSVLAKFRLRDLDVDKIAQDFAWDVQGRLIYVFSAHAPQDCINAYYDDMQMSGWWPQVTRDWDD